MIKVDERETAQRLVCPNCLTLLERVDRECPLCQSSLAWLEHFDVLRTALLGVDQRWPCELRLAASWPGGETELRRPWDAEIRLATGDGEPWEFKVQGPPYELMMTRAGRSQQLSLPGEATLEGLRISAALVAASAGDGDPGSIKSFAPTLIDVSDSAFVTLGSEIASDVHEIADSDIDLRHSVLVHQPEPSNYWITDLGSAKGTFVNRQRILVSRLHGGDFVQLGGHAWTFNESDGLLVPVRPIEGIELRLNNVAVKGRLLPIDLHISPGQFVAVAGASGTGKSTLMRALLGEPHSRTQGSIVAGGYDCDRDRDEYRRRLGYVSQKAVVHADLKAQDAVEFGAELRGKQVAEEQTAELLRRLDLQEGLWQRTPGSMSGGESQRVRIAAELIAGPQLLFLDEPAKGLDQGREIALTKLLRGLSYQGCTVFVITHGLAHLDFFDRVLILRKTSRGGRLCFDGSTDDLRKKIPSRDFADLDLSDPPQSLPTTSPSSIHSTVSSAEESRSKSKRSALEDALSQGWEQLKVLFRRETSIVANSWFRRIVLPLLLVPCAFALSISVAVPEGSLHLLGFFAVLSCIWMGASLSLLSIVDERVVLDHEHLLFLRLGSYVAGKTGVLWLFSSIQSIVFTLLLTIFRSVLFPDQPGEDHVSPTDGPMLYSPFTVGLYLALVGWGAVGAGLVISALSGTRSVVANFILPLVMMVQIVFSVHVAGDGNASVGIAYGEFNAKHCQGRLECPRRVDRRTDDGRFLCKKCRDRPEAANDEKPESQADKEKALEYNRERPNVWAARASTFTLSRYGDMALSCFAYEKGGEDTSKKNAVAYWRNHARFRLIVGVLFLPLATLLILWLQTTGKTYYLRQSLTEHGRRNLSLRIRLLVRSLLDRIQQSRSRPKTS